MFRLLNRLKNRKGFTLIELVVVLSLLGIIGMIVVPRLIGMTSSSRNKADTSNAQILTNATSLYKSENGIWPWVDEYSIQTIDKTDPKLGPYLPNKIEVQNPENHFVFASGAFYISASLGTPPETTPPETTGPSEPTETVITYTVTFKDWNDTVLETQDVVSGEGTSAPSDPTREG